ncbi:hypothetical protein N9903_01720 [bacterium]|nr:hypothetical protein [bacterium]
MCRPGSSFKGKARLFAIFVIFPFFTGATPAFAVQDIIDSEIRSLLPEMGEKNAQQILQGMDNYDEIHFNIPAKRYFHRFSFELHQKDVDADRRRPVLVLFYDSSGRTQRDSWVALTFKILFILHSPKVKFMAVNLGVNTEALCDSLNGDLFGLPDIKGTPSMSLFTVENGDVRLYDTEYVGPEAKIHISSSVWDKVLKWIGPAVYPGLTAFTFGGRRYSLDQPYFYHNSHTLSEIDSP